MNETADRMAATSGRGGIGIPFRALLFAAICPVILAMGACSSAPPEKDPALARPEQAMRDGVRAFRLDDYRAAEQRFLEALARFRSIDHADGETDALINLADTALARSETEHARVYLKQARAVDPGGENARLDLIAARLALADGDHERVRARTDELLAGETPGITRAALVVRTKSAMASPDEPAGPWLERLESAADGDTPLLRAGWLRLGARAAASAKEKRTMLEQALNIYRNAHYRPGIAAARAALGDVAAGASEWMAAWRHYRRALLIRLWLADRHQASDLIERMLPIAKEVEAGPAPDVLRDWRDYLAREDINWERLRAQSSGL